MMTWSLWLLGILGHAAIWATLFNQIHATACRRQSRKFSEKVILLIVFLPIGLLAMAVVSWSSLGREFNPLDSIVPGTGTWWHRIALMYGYGCIPVGIFFAGRWMYRKLTKRVPAAVLSDEEELLDIKNVLNERLLKGWTARCLGFVPFNQVLKLAVKRLEIVLDIPTELDGLKVCHLSDLHFTGQIAQRYFQHLVEIANQFEPQLTVITGDIIDKDHCIEWLRETLGKLKSELGCFYVLGNHDLFVQDQKRYLRELERLGLFRVNAGWTCVRYRDVIIRLAGNELPWFAGANELPKLSPRVANEFRLLLTHSPDQVDWAVQHDFDLILAGHNHGGQISFPLIGAVIVPSRHGVKYACGTFEKGRMIMHVSRGISGDEPIRVCCPPELGLITLRSSRLRAPTQRQPF